MLSSHELTPSEYALFSAMAKRPGMIFARAQLLDVVRRDALDVADRAIDSHIKNLRLKIQSVAPDSDLIQSVYGRSKAVKKSRSTERRT